MLSTDVQLHLFRKIFGEKLLEHLCYNVVGRPMLLFCHCLRDATDGGRLFVNLGEDRRLPNRNGIWHKAFCADGYLTAT